MNFVPGTRGYEKSVGAFVETSQALSFHQVCRDFLEFLPVDPGSVLDAGSGAGQNAAALAEMGHSVVAIEPMVQFLTAARQSYPDRQITWLQDCMPALRCLGADDYSFEFILVDGVWHHLNEAERASALERLAGLLNPGGRCALSLRNGPPGMGSRVFPTDAEATIQQANKSGLGCIFRKENQPSIQPQKQDVKWARIVLINETRRS